MKDKPTRMPLKEGSVLYDRVRQILESARTNVSRTVNTTQVVANWLIGREIVEEEQKGRRRAGYGEQILEDLSIRLTNDFGTGYSGQNLRFMRQFYLTYPALLDDPGIRYAVRSESAVNVESTPNKIRTRCVRNHKYSIVQRPPRLATHCVANLGNRGIFIRICPGHTTGHFCGWIKQKPALSMRLKPFKIAGQPANWSGRSTVYCLNVYL